MGNVNLLYGDKATAIEHLEAAIELQPDNERLKRLLEAARRYRR